MKYVKTLLLFFVFILSVTGCAEDPGPIPENMSRIKVKCTGFNLNEYEVVVTATDKATDYYEMDYLGCIFSDAIYFNVPVPPNSYDVQYGMTRKTAVFNSIGEQVTVEFESYFISDMEAI